MGKGRLPGLRLRHSLRAQGDESWLWTASRDPGPDAGSWYETRPMDRPPQLSTVHTWVRLLFSGRLGRVPVMPEKRKVQTDSELKRLGETGVGILPVFTVRVWTVRIPSAVSPVHLRRRRENRGVPLSPPGDWTRLGPGAGSLQDKPQWRTPLPTPLGPFGPQMWAHRHKFLTEVLVYSPLAGERLRGRGHGVACWHPVRAKVGRVRVRVEGRRSPFGQRKAPSSLPRSRGLSPTRLGTGRASSEEVGARVDVPRRPDPGGGPRRPSAAGRDAEDTGGHGPQGPADTRGPRGRHGRRGRRYASQDKWAWACPPSPLPRTGRRLAARLRTGQASRRERPRVRRPGRRLARPRRARSRP